MSNTCVMDLFEKPPLELLEDHMRDVLACVEFLPDFFAAIAAGDWAAAEATYLQVVKYEHAADEKKAKFRKLLRKDLILQLSKRELLKIMHEQDKMANATRDICGLMLWRRTQFPKVAEAALTQYTQAIIETCQHAAHCLATLAALVAAVFAKDGIQKLDDNLLLLEKSESITDDLQCNIRNLLLSEEKNYSAIQMICFYDIVSNIGNIADLAESYGHFLFVCVSD